MNTELSSIKPIVEAALMVADAPMTVKQLLLLFDKQQRPAGQTVYAVLQQLQQECVARGVELKEVANGFRYQAKQEYVPWIKKLWEQRPPKYSRALMETLVLIAYRQPITRAEIEEIRGVAVNSQIIKTLAEREWIKVIGHRDVPGRPALLGTTKAFLDYFNLKSLNNLPTLAEIQDLDKHADQLQKQMQLDALTLEDKQQHHDTISSSMTQQIQQQAEAIVKDVENDEEMSIVEEVLPQREQDK